MIRRSPAAKTGLALNRTITADGTVIDTDRLVSIETWSQANRVPRARIVLFDGDAAKGTFPYSESATFVPGTKLVIAAGYGSEATTIHSGVVIRHTVRILPGTAAQLVIETADPMLKMTLVRKSAVTQKSEKSSDHALIASLVTANGGTIGKNAASREQREAQVQAYTSDWDLMLLRAEANGCVVTLAGGKVEVIAPGDAAPSVMTLGYGDSLISFDATIDASGALGTAAVTSRAWNYADQKISTAKASAANVGVPGNLSTAKLATVMDVAAFVQQTSAAQDIQVLTDWSTATLLRARLGQVAGTAKVQGSAKLLPGVQVTLDGLGGRFNGDAFVSGVCHHLRGGDWHSTVEIGMAAERFASSSRAIADPPAGGLSAPIRGLHTGQVVKVAEDVNGDFRVLVTLPLIDAANGIWARLAQPYASKGFGWSFFPEVGDEVVLGFMNEDPASAVIVASVYSNQRAPKHTPVIANDEKALVTRSKLELNFNDKDVVLKILTPGGRILTLDDKAQTVSVVDPKGNKLVMTAQSVEVISTAAMTIKSTGNMEIKSGGVLTMSAATSFNISAPNVSVTGKSSLALASNATASLKAAAVLQVNGALVKIN